MSLVFNMVDGGSIKLSGLAITTAPAKTAYLQGESFDTAGMVVTATYSNGATLVCTGYTVEPSGALADGVTSVTVYYTEGGVTKTAVQPITVTHRMTGITITAQPTKTVYEYADTFQSVGMAVQASYSDGTTATVTDYSYSPTTLSTVGTQTITVSYTENSVTKTATTSVTVNRKTISAVPSQSGTLTYTGSSQSPSWSNYNTTYMTIGGTTSGTNAGSYTATFTPKSNYRWSDGTTTAKSVTWAISKAAGSLSISPASLTMSYLDGYKGIITVEYSGDGAISAVSSNTAVATVRVAGSEVQATGVGNGSATITVSVAEGTNYTAPASQTCTVTAENYPSDTFEDNSWYTIICACQLREIPDTWAVGDSKTMTINGTDYQIDIIGKDHDTYSDGSGTAPLTFQIHDCYNMTTYTMNSSATNKGGWTECAMRETHLPAILELMPSAVQNSIRAVNKLTSAGSKSSTINTTADKLFLLSEVEIFGSTTYSKSGEGTQYAYYKAGNSMIKYRSGSASAWWERSPYASGTSYFCYVSSKGKVNYTGAAAYAGVVFAFCF